MKQEQAAAIFHQLRHEYGLSDKWKLAWEAMSRSHGCCRYGTTTITLHPGFVGLNSKKIVVNLIKHELAHAIVRQEFGTVKQSHGKEFKLVCKRIGCPTTKSSVQNTLATPIPKAWTGTCQKCGKQYSAAILTDKRKKWSCARCDKRYNPDNILVWACTDAKLLAKAKKLAKSHSSGS